MPNLRSITFLAGLAMFVAPALQARELTLEDRVAAQAAIDRVYYGHQIGAARPFEEALPRAVLEAKVEKYLKQSVALEKFWNTPVTTEMLQAEMERQARQSRMPERLYELYDALGDDPFLVRECLARPALVDRLARNFFAFDERVHAAARAEAEALRQAVLRYGIEAFAYDPRRSEIEIVLAVPEQEPAAAAPERDELRRIELPPEEFARWRAQAPQWPGEIGPIREEGEAFVMQVVLEQDSSSSRVASFAVAKRTWDSWWVEQARVLDASSATAGVQDAAGQLPLVPLASCDPDDTWTPTSTASSPSPRAYHTAVWTGSLMVVWGGVGVEELGSGARYDPALDVWTPTSTLNAPVARFDHTAVWTGSRVVIWGGRTDACTATNTGGRYDPLTDTWTPMTTAGAPVFRFHHTAVWTGSRMIIWGGEFEIDCDEVIYLNTGGRYDPVLDTWAPTSTVNVPFSREGHTAIWTGTHMIVWGGEHLGSVFLDSGSYDLATDSWTSIAGAPVGRHYHTAVWTGTEMIVWGGLNSGGLAQNSGWRYSPAANTWTATSTGANVPSVRIRHTAVWTGSRMVVWGGENSHNVINTGGRYDPTTNSWAPTSTTDAPSARSLHTAVWTGSRMVVWGGLDGGGLTSNTGGRYGLGSSTDGDDDGLAGCQGDCNDGNPQVYPGAVEACDGLDNDCDGIIGDVDQDGDGACVPLDCDDLDPQSQLVALEVQGVMIEKRQPTRIHFSSQDRSAGAGTSYDVASGLLSDLQASADFNQAACVGNFSDTPAQDAGPDPGSGQGYYYLLRAKNSCGSGSWGQGSDGSDRIVNACP